MADIITNITPVTTWIIGMIPTVCGVIVDNALLFCTVGFMFLGGVVSMISRLLRR